MLDGSRIIDGRYRVDRHVGEGGFGAVYAGLHLVLGVPVAIKVMRPAAGVDQDARADEMTRFLDEGRVLTRLRHPNIVAVLDLGVVQDPNQGPSPYLVMEWVGGTTLRKFMDANRRPMSLFEAWRLFEPLAAAVAHAHAVQVVHRDLTPSNVMVVQDATGAAVPRVIDFGMAKVVAVDDVAGHGHTFSATQNAFTPAYAAPEQVTQSRTGAWTDVHALGLLFLELVTGAPPYGRSGNPRQEVVDPERPSARARGVDIGALEPVLARALALRPADRYPNASELLVAARQAMMAPRMPSGAPAFAPSIAPALGPSFAPPPPHLQVTQQDTGAPASRTVVEGKRTSTVPRGVVIGASSLVLLALVAGAGVLVVPRFLLSDVAEPGPADAGGGAGSLAPTTKPTTVVPAPVPPGKHTPAVPSSSPTPPHPPPSPSPSPSPAPPPSPPPGPGPAPQRALEYSAGLGSYGGLYPKDPDLVAVPNTRASSLKSCFSGSTAVTDAWSVRVKVLFQKDGSRSFAASTTHEGSPDTSSTASALESCHTAAMKSWPWPSSAGIEGLNGGPGYMIILSGMYWHAR